eukprot:CAMPEP_0170507016 /NCGR_PEP_ID=MMETSP0208-20121228/57340_1 /TAXON_ID=197538 /ORGANISM="Strombidium inclinatum, Strain S3" /LENGTH=71 /DNA_ID=CAMNT_0010788947 /DNA_START=1889 /DNA_END=2101 /DNA_ORIENTATION=+
MTESEIGKHYADQNNVFNCDESVHSANFRDMMGETPNQTEAVHGYSLIKLQERECLGNTCVYRAEERARCQ